MPKNTINPLAKGDRRPSTDSFDRPKWPIVNKNPDSFCQNNAT